MGSVLLVVAGTMSLGVAVFHVVMAFKPNWQRTFGAPEKLIEAGPLAIGLAAIGMAVVFGAWGLYGLSGAGSIGKLPLLAACLVAIGAVYTLRGVMLAPQLLAIGGRLHREMPTTGPDLASSAVSLTIGLVYLAGTLAAWSSLG